MTAATPRKGRPTLHQCRRCPKSFDRQSNLLHHQRNAHKHPNPPAGSVTYTRVR